MYNITKLNTNINLWKMITRSKRVTYKRSVGILLF